MRNTITAFVLLGLITSFFIARKFVFSKNTLSGAPPFGVTEENTPTFGILSWLSDWERPEGPPKVALQVGHWKNDELPDELFKLRANTGSSAGGKAEWEVNLAIALETAEQLENHGIEVEILPATVPQSYWADVFISIHVDGSTDSSKRGFKVAAPWRDYTRRSNGLVDILEKTYQESTGFEIDPNVTRNMRGYYAFSWWRYEHAIHPMTTAVIFEAGFLTNAADRKLLLNNPGVIAHGFADGILEFLQNENLI